MYILSSPGSDLDSYVTDGRILELPWKGAAEQSNYTFCTGWHKWWCRCYHQWFNCIRLRSLLPNSCGKWRCWRVGSWVAALLEGYASQCTNIIEWWQVSCLFIWDLNHSLILCRIILNYIQCWLISHLMYSHVQPHQSHVNIYYPHQSRLLRIDIPIWGLRNSRNFNWWSSHGEIISLILLHGTQHRLRR